MQGSISCKYTLNFISSLFWNKLLVHSPIFLLTQSIKPYVLIIYPIQDMDFHAFLPHTLKVLKTYHITPLKSQAHWQARGMWRIFHLKSCPWKSSSGLEWLSIVSAESHWYSWEKNTAQKGEWAAASSKGPSTPSLRIHEDGGQS